MFDRCDIRLEFDEPDRNYRAGEAVTGRVHVRVDDDCDCKGLELTCQWFTHGRGRRAEGGEHSEEIFSGAWQAGRHYEYPFELRLPNGPCSYHGHYVNVDWRLEAVASVSWARNPSDEADFLVLPAPEFVDEPYRHGNPDCRHHRRARKQRPDRTMHPVVTVMLLGMLTLCFGVPLVSAAQSDPSALLCGGVFLIPFYGMFLKLLYDDWLRNKLAERKMGDVDVELTDTAVRAGETTRAIVDIPPSSNAHVNEISVTLKCLERVRYRQGTKTKTTTREMYEHTETIPESVDRDFAAGVSAHLTQPLEIPEDAAPSFYAKDNQVMWFAEIDIDIEGWPDWQESLPLDVQPVPDGSTARRQLGDREGAAIQTSG